METLPLAFSPPSIHGSRLQCLGRSRGSHFPAAPRAEPCHSPALPGVPGSGGCEKSPIPHSLRLSGQVRAVTGTGDAPASSREGSPSSQQLPRTGGGCAAHKGRRVWCCRGAAAAMVSWGNRSVTVGRVAAGMETETQRFRLGVCLSKIGRSRVSALPRPNAVCGCGDAVLPPPKGGSKSGFLRSAASDGGTAEPAAPWAAPLLLAVSRARPEALCNTVKAVCF